MSEIDMRPGTPLGRYLIEAQEKEGMRQLLASLMRRDALLQARIATLEARERRVRELVKPFGYASCNEEFNRGWDALSARILTILNEGAAE